MQGSNFHLGPVDLVATGLGCFPVIVLATDLATKSWGASHSIPRVACESAAGVNLQPAYDTSPPAWMHSNQFRDLDLGVEQSHM